VLIKVTSLTKSNAFNPGSDLWVIPDLVESAISQRIDWYLNFQIHRFLVHSKKEISQALKEIMTQCELKDLDFISNNKKKNYGLLISSCHLLPNRWIYCLNVSSIGASQWVQNSFDVWSKLNQPSIRYVLPKTLSSVEFSPLLESHSFTQDISIVSEVSL
jgi:hypothetical protein